MPSQAAPGPSDRTSVADRLAEEADERDVVRRLVDRAEARRAVVVRHLVEVVRRTRELFALLRRPGDGEVDVVGDVDGARPLPGAFLRVRPGRNPAAEERAAALSDPAGRRRSRRDVDVELRADL